jgi:signal peptidase I
MNQTRTKPARSPAKRVRAGEAERQSGRTAAARRRWSAAMAATTSGLLFLFLMKFVFFIGYVPSLSMEPAIKQNSFIFGIRMFEEPTRGDVVVFACEGRLLVKRIAALPGDTAQVRGETLTVPDGCYFMLGDNAEASVDSRYWEEPFVSGEWIVAKIWA